VEEFEKIIIGSVIHPGLNAWPKVKHLTPEDFQNADYRLIFRRVQILKEEGKEGNYLEVYSSFAPAEREKVSAPQLSELAESAFSVAGLDSVADKIKAASQLSQLKVLTKGIESKILKSEDSVRTVAEFSRKVDQLYNVEKKDKTKIADVIKEYFHEKAQEEQKLKISCGITALDKLLGGGFRDGHLVIIGAETSGGKTALASLFATAVSKQTQKKVVFFALEMSKSEIAERFVHYFGGPQFGWGPLSERNIEIFERPHITVAEIKSICQELSLEGDGIGLVVIDYLGLIDMGEEKEVVALGRITRELKIMAKELSCPVITPAQFAKEVKENKNRLPEVLNLRGSASIGQNADEVLILQRAKIQGSLMWQDEAILHLAKNRHGKVGEAYLQMMNGAKFVEIDERPDFYTPPVRKYQGRSHGRQENQGEGLPGF